MTIHSSLAGQTEALQLRDELRQGKEELLQTLQRNVQASADSVRSQSVLEIAALSESVDARLCQTRVEVEESSKASRDATDAAAQAALAALTASVEDLRVQGTYVAMIS